MPRNTGSNHAMRRAKQVAKEREKAVKVTHVPNGAEMPAGFRYDYITEQLTYNGTPVMSGETAHSIMTYPATPASQQALDELAQATQSVRESMLDTMSTVVQGVASGTSGFTLTTTTNPGYDPHFPTGGAMPMSVMPGVVAPSARRAAHRPPDGWTLVWVNYTERYALSWDPDNETGAIMIHPDTWRRVNTDSELAGEFTLAVGEAEGYGTVQIHVNVPPVTFGGRGGAASAPLTEAQRLMEDITQLAGQVAVGSGPLSALDLASRYAALRDRLQAMRRDLAQVEGMFEVAHQWLAQDETGRPGIAAPRASVEDSVAALQRVADSCA